MNKSDLIEEVTRATGLGPDVSERVVTTVFDRITEALVRGELVDLRGLGTFGVRQRPARVGRNPKTGAPVAVPARRVAFFRMGKELRTILNPRAAQQVPA
jgi:integration host factor subunit beta